MLKAPQSGAFVVELRGFEPLTPSMRTRCATGLRHSPGIGSPGRPGPSARLAGTTRALARPALGRLGREGILVVEPGEIDCVVVVQRQVVVVDADR
jgi:hypothetical protein